MECRTTLKRWLNLSSNFAMKQLAGHIFSGFGGPRDFNAGTAGMARLGRFAQASGSA
jgi:hypothetical protein